MGPRLAHESKPAILIFLEDPQFILSKAHPTNNTLFVQISDGVVYLLALFSLPTH